MAEKSILGIDLRVTSVKVVELKKGSKGWVLTGWGMEEIPYDLIEKHPDKEAAQARAIQKILAVARIKTREAVVVIGGGDIVIKRMVMPAISRAEIKEAIRWKIKDEIGYPIEEAIVDFIPVGKGVGKDEVDYLVSAAHRESVNRVVEVMKMSGLRLEGIVPVPVSLGELCRKQINKDTVQAVVYMGRRTTNISFFKNGQIRFSREVPLGGEDITKAMTSVLVSDEGRLELKYDEAEKIKREYGIPIDLNTYPKLGDIPIAQLQAVVRPALEKVEDEILRTIEYFKNQEGEISIEKVIISGGASKTPHILEFLSAGLGIPFQTFDQLADIVVDNKVHEKGHLSLVGPQLAACLGAGMSSFTKTVNLLPEEIRDKWKILARKHANPVEISAAFVGLAFLYYAFMFYMAFSIQLSIDQVQKKSVELKPRLVRLEELEKAVKEEEGRRGVFKTIELSRVKIPKVLEDISLNMPASVMMHSITIVEASKQVTLRGVVFGKGDSPENILSKFMSNLSNAPSFKEVELIEASKMSGFTYDSFAFQLMGTVKKKDET